MKIFICEDDVKQRENMVSIINNYIMIEEKLWRLRLQQTILMKSLKNLKR